jgi:amino acid adenylation domain-containing protein/FkbM family methyltransferase/non-ribosomal peptide synthase protein (TIGR01720 family)
MMTIPLDSTIVTLIEERIRAQPEDIALSCRDRSMSYSDLDMSANQIAIALRVAGVRPESLVGVCAGRDVELIVALFGVLKAGGAYLPLDPAYPKERLSFMIGDSRASVVLAERKFAHLVSDCGVRALYIEDILMARTRPVRGSASPAAGPENLAYVIYTSGSAGHPKGVEICHRNVVALFASTQDWGGFGGDDTWTLFHSVSFDFSVWELWGALIHGSRLVIVPFEISRSPSELAELLERERVSVLSQTPSAFRQLIRAVVEKGHVGPWLRLVIFGGEPLDRTMLAPWYELFGDRRPALVNMYGITETTVHVTHLRLPRAEPAASKSIGKPLSFARVHVLDESASPAPAGSVGEIYVGGSGVARGYRGRPALTAERFVPDSFSDVVTARLYRTGDLGRLLSDGNIEFLGRADGQVKIRGYRIEPGEIESVLREHAAVRDAAVTVAEDSLRGRRLIAFVAADGVPSRLGGADGTILLPDGRRAHILNRPETDFMIREIYSERAYLQDGIELPDGACIVDAGANIGLFDIFALSECHDPEILAFEPIPPTYDVLRRNFKLNGIRGRTFPYGLGSSDELVDFSFYQNASVLSGRFAGEDDMLAVKSFMLKRLAGMGRNGKDVSSEMVADLVSERLLMVPYSCRIRPLSDVLAEEGVGHVDLLKIDVEKSEADVLAGISSRDFAKIDQIVIEVHDLQDRLSRITDLLRDVGYEISVRRDATLETTSLYNLYARRKGRTPASRPGRWPHARLAALAADEAPGSGLGRAVAPPPGSSLAADLRLFARERLPDFMVPAVIIPVDRLPLTANGKLDRDALRVPDGTRPEFGVSYVAPRTAAESAFVSLWEQTLGIAHVGMNDNFFDLGGDSILGLQLLSLIQATTGRRLLARVLFDAPTVAQLASRLEGETVLSEDVMQPADRTVPIPLSFGQRRLWFLHEFEPGSCEYNLPFAYRVDGHLDIDALEAAFSMLAAQHEPLRTTFATVEGRGVQVIEMPATVPVVVTDLSGLTEGERQAGVSRFLRDEPAQPFDLHSSPPLRVRALRLGPAEYLLLLVMHHVATDGWSVGILAAQLGSLYGAALRGDRSGSSPSAVQYADFAVWQHRRLSGGLLSRQLAYWRDELAGLVPLELPTDRPRPVVRVSEGAEHKFTVPGEIVAGLRQLGREQDATLFMVLTAACQLLLARYCGQEDVAVATVSSGRDRAELRNLIGFFINTVILRDRVKPELSFRQFLSNVRSTVLDAVANDEVPFERLVEELSLGRDPGRMPLAPVMIILQNAPATSLRLSGCRVAEVPLPRSSAVFDITVEFAEVDDGLTVRIAYSTALFDPPAIERMARDLLITLDRVATEPDCPMARLPVLTEAELDLRVPGRVETASDDGITVIELFRQQAARAPQDVAVTYADISLTYGDLAERSARLAGYLRTLGVGPETLVPICVDRGPEFITGILAILQAGGAYVPLPPEYPRDRLARMLAETGAEVLVTQSWLRSRIAVPTRVRVDLDTFDHGDRPTVDDARDGPGPDDLAYIMYTSGSTGTPKGVMMEHRSLLNVVRAKVALLGVGPRDTVLQFASVGFDVSVTEIFVALTAGARLCVAERSGQDDLLGKLRSEQVSVATLPTALLAALMPGDLPSLRVIEACGEACPSSVVDTWAHGRTFLNGYGPTESICATMSQCHPDALAPPAIGKPVPNVVAYVLDTSLNPVTAGVTGELYLGGAQLARGYLGQPARTAERFVPSPFGEPGSRLYRTGDLVRLLPSGELGFVSRVDTQVKIRGFRVELTEVEATLRQHPDVSDARVLMLRDGMRGRLVAYTVHRAGCGGLPSASGLREYLLRVLPDYMVPSEFVALDALPLNDNGKLDQVALPVPRLAPGDDRRPYTPPRNGTEATLASIWAAALGMDRVGVTDNFFDLGGDSILSMQVVFQARRAGLDFSPRQMFMRQTIAVLAEEIAEASPPRDERLPDEQRDAPLAPAQRRLFMSTVGPWDAWQSVLLEFGPGIDHQALRVAIAALLAQHGALGTCFEETDGQWRQRGGTADLESVLRVANLSGSGQPDPSVLRALADSDARHEPPVRVLLLDVSGGMRLLLMVHALVADDFSWHVLLQDLTRGYRQAVAGRAPDLGQMTATFCEWSARLASDALAGRFDDELGHWQETEHRALGIPRLPCVSSEGGAGDRPAVAFSEWLGEPETAVLTRLAPGHLMARVDEVLLAAVAVVLAARTGSGRVCVGVADSSREYPFVDLCTDRTVGCFTAIYPCVIEIPPSADLGSVVGSVRQQLRRVPRHGLGYAALVRTEPVPDVVFSYVGEFGDDLAQCGARMLRAPGPDPDSQRRVLSGGLEIRCGAVHGRLQAEWAYPPDRYAQQAVESLACDYMSVLRELARLALATEGAP